MIGDPWVADSAQEDSVERFEQVEAVLGHHAADAMEALAAPVECVPVQFESVTARGGLEYMLSGGHDFVTNAVAGDHCNAVSACHGVAFEG